MRIVMNRAAVDKIVNAALVAAQQTAYAIKQDVDEAAVVPRETGDLENSGFVDSSRKAEGQFQLVYNTPYARRLYWHPEYNFRTDKNANARGEWLTPWLDGDKKNFARETFRKEFKRRAGL